MELWQALQFALALHVAISALALIINKFNIIQRAELSSWKRKAKERIQLM